MAKENNPKELPAQPPILAKSEEEIRELNRLSKVLRFSIIKENISRGESFKAIITPINHVKIKKNQRTVTVKTLAESGHQSDNEYLFAVKFTNENGEKLYKLLINPEDFNDQSISFGVNTEGLFRNSGEYLVTLGVINSNELSIGQIVEYFNSFNDSGDGEIRAIITKIFTVLAGAGVTNLTINEPIQEPVPQQPEDPNRIFNVRLHRNVSENRHNQDRWDIISKRKTSFSLIKNISDRIIAGDLNATGRNALNPTLDIPGNPVLDINGNDNNGGNRRLNRLPFLNSNTYSALRFGIGEFLNRGQGRNAINNGGWIANNVPDPVVDYIEHIIDEIGDFYTAFGGNENPNLQMSNYELIWSYWMEQGMLVQSINMINFRFQNISPYEKESPLNRFDIAPLYPLSDLLWNYIQDEQHTLMIKRRMNEYQHEYGLNLIGNAVGNNRNVDNRSKFLESFNTLLNSCALFFKDADDTTRIADGFPLLNCLREVHMLLAEGFHNAYSNLTFTSRAEMTLQQVILARPEMQEFLGAKPMVPYTELWIGRVDTLRQMNGWGATSMSHFYDLAVHGERLLLSIRFTPWNQIDDSDVAADWAIHFRNEIQRYIHSYRTVTGVDLSADSSDNKEMFAVQPSMLIQRRVQNEKMLSMPRRNFARQAYY